MTRTDAIVGGALAVVFLALAWGATALTYADEFAPGPAFAPLWFAATGLVLALSIVVSGVRALPAGDSQTQGLARLGLAVLAVGLAVAVAPAVGFHTAMAALLLFITLAVMRMSPVSAVATSVTTVAIVYVVFDRLLDVPFPHGPLGF